MADGSFVGSCWDSAELEWHGVGNVYACCSGGLTMVVASSANWSTISLPIIHVSALTFQVVILWAIFG